MPHRTANEAGIPLLVVLGPTASGKTQLAVQLARRLDAEGARAEVVSADARQVYRELELGAGKDRDEYRRGGAPVPVHLLDVATLDTEYHLFAYQRDCYAVLRALAARRVLPILCGGTGLYLEAVLDAYPLVEAPEDPALRARLAGLPDDALAARLAHYSQSPHNTTDLTDRARTIRAIEIAEYSAAHPPAPAPPLRPIVLGVCWPPGRLRSRIAARLHARLQAGLIAEVARLHEAGHDWERLERLGLEYRFIAEYLQGRIANEHALVQQLGTAIAQFAKRQRTWFRRMERRGTRIHWVEAGEVEEAWALVRRESDCWAGTYAAR